MNVIDLNTMAPVGGKQTMESLCSGDLIEKAVTKADEAEVVIMDPDRELEPGKHCRVRALHTL
jgi:hypothetical protein